MGRFFSKINAPTFVATVVFIMVDKKLGISDKILARI